MKFIFKLFLLTLFTFSTINSQNVFVEKFDETNTKSYKIDARKFLAEQEKEVTQFLIENPNYFEEQKLKKTVAWDFTVGSIKEWWASNLETGSFYKVPSTCQSVGTNCYIFVEDAIWNSRVTIESVNGIKEAFDNKTPANDTKGIYDTVVDAFGSPPDVDGDEKIIILILDIKDGYTGTGGYVAGYFYSVNQVPGPNSNMAEIYYLDADPADLSTEHGLENVMSTTAHEFQHMVHFNYHNGTGSPGPSQLTFLNEACSEVSEVVCGYGIRGQSLYNNETNHYLFDWRDNDDPGVLTDYARAARYMTYFYDQFGTDFLGKFVQSSLVGISGINDALSKLTTPTALRFPETLENWFMANIVNDMSVAPEWGYTTSNVTKVNPLNIANPNYTSSNISLAIMGSDYITYSAGKNLSITFDDKNQGITKFKAIKHLNSGVVVEDVAPNVEQNYSDFGTDYNAITFVAMNTNQSFNATYSYTSTGESGTVLLAYDLNPPTGVLGLTANDTVCDVFDGVSGGIIDSITVALRQAGSVMGGIYEYTGATRPTPLGKTLLSDLTITSSIAEKPAYPYPEPWTNWVTVDLSSHNIDASNPFVAAFVVEGSYPANNRIMITEQPDVNNHSFTYLNSQEPPDWFYLSSGTDSVFAYLIRAYVNTIVGVDDEQFEIILNEFSLHQNYPNPFNPSTTINYSIAKSGFVTLKIYNMLGQEIAKLVSENKSAGNYTALFDASQLSSGTYLYKLSSRNQHVTKKMLLIK